MKKRPDSSEAQRRPNRATYERTTITVPTELKEQMKELGRDINWSSVACQAFESKIDAIRESQKKQLEHAIIRLRGEKGDRTGGAVFDEGRSAGRQWAIERASIESLQSLAEKRTSMSKAEWDALFESEDAIDTIGNLLHEEIVFQDELYEQAVSIIIKHGKGSVSLLQRELSIGYGRGARLIDLMEADGVVGPYNGAKSRAVIVTEREPSAALWKSVLERVPPIDPDFYAGFVDGAIEVWSTVREAI